MKKLFLLLQFLIPVLVLAQKDSILSGIYTIPKTAEQNNKQFSTVLFKGKTTDMSSLQMSFTKIAGLRTLRLRVAADEEQLILIKSGRLTIAFNDSTWTLSNGSIILLMPGELYSLQVSSGDTCAYYTMTYRSKLPADIARGKAGGGSMVKDWNELPFKPHERGGVRNYFARPTAMSRRFEMHVTTLNEGIKSHEPHTHQAEEIILVIDNKTEMEIAGRLYKGNTGDIYYLGANVSHAIKNDGNGQCLYFAFQFE